MTATVVIDHAKKILTDALADLDVLINMCSGDDNALTVDILMTRKEAASYIGRTVQSLDRLCREGRIRKTYQNGQPRIRRSELLAFKGVIFDMPDESEQSALGNIIRRFTNEIRN